MFYAATEMTKNTPITALFALLVTAAVNQSTQTAGNN